MDERREFQLRGNKFRGEKRELRGESSSFAGINSELGLWILNGESGWYKEEDEEVL